ncbi:MAG: carboxymuconolactone decarboxylase family protein [Gemmatimonadota bacterium]
MVRLPPLDSESIEDARVLKGFEDMERRMGEVTENLRILAHKPLYVELIGTVSDTIDAPTEIDSALKQLVELKTARLNGCEYSVDLLEGCLLRKGVGEAKLRELDFYEESTLFDDREKNALKFTERMVLDAVDDTLFHETRRTFTTGEMLELLMTVALESFYCLVNRTLGLKPQGFRDRALSEIEAATAEENAG